MELQRGLNIHLPFIKLFNQRVYVSVKCHGYTFECSVVKRFHYLLLTGIVHNDIKGDNTFPCRIRHYFFAM